MSAGSPVSPASPAPRGSVGPVASLIAGARRTARRTPGTTRTVVGGLHHASPQDHPF